MAPELTGAMNKLIYRVMTLSNAKLANRPGMFLAEHADVTSYLKSMCLDSHVPVNDAQRDFIVELKSPTVRCADAWSGVFNKMMRGIHDWPCSFCRKFHNR